MSEVFAEGEEEFGQEAMARKPVPPPPRMVAEPDELVRMRERLKAADLGPEPTDPEPRLRWHIAKRIRCTDVACTDTHLRAIEAQGNVSDLLVTVLRTGPSNAERQEAAMLLGLLGHESAAPEVARLIDEPLAPLRLAACRALRWLNNPAVTESLVHGLSRARDSRERRCFIRALTGRPGQSAALALGNVALGSQMDEALVAVTALKARKDPEVVTVLGKVMENGPTWAVRRAALEALNGLDSGVARRAVRQAARSRDSQVRDLARRLIDERRRR